MEPGVTTEPGVRTEPPLEIVPGVKTASVGQVESGIPSDPIWGPKPSGVETLVVGHSLSQGPATTVSPTTTGPRTTRIAPGVLSQRLR